jgi:hypothetical protein
MFAHKQAIGDEPVHPSTNNRPMGDHKNLPWVDILLLIKEKQ